MLQIHDGRRLPSWIRSAESWDHSFEGQLLVAILCENFVVIGLV